MAYTQRIQVRFDDVDYAQVVYFPRFFAYCHWVFEDFFTKEAGVPYAEMLQKRRVGFPTVHSEADFKLPLRFGDLCRIVMETTRLGEGSITNRYRLHNGDSPRVSAVIQLVTASVSMDTFKPVPMPEDIRVAFLNHLVGYKSA
jgi:4-hydroxybenzoyl-CoA thioesterase